MFIFLLDLEVVNWICLLSFQSLFECSSIRMSLLFLAHVLFSALVGVFGGFLGCRLYRLGVFTIGECLGLVSSTQSFAGSKL